MIRFKDRTQWLPHIIPNSICAEIGVERGWYAHHIRLHQPAKLYLIDIWRYQEVGYENDGANRPTSVQESFYEQIVQKYANDYVVEVIRAMSLSVADCFPDDYFDFIYIDANHSHDAVLADMRAWWKKVKRGGILAGHDYDCPKHHCERPVHAFLGEHGLGLSLLTEAEDSSGRKSWGIIRHGA